MDSSDTGPPIPSKDENRLAAPKPSVVVSPPLPPKKSRNREHRPKLSISSTEDIPPLVPVRSPLRPPARSPLRPPVTPRSAESALDAAGNEVASTSTDVSVVNSRNPNGKVETISVLLDKIQLGFEEASILGLDDVREGFEGDIDYDGAKSVSPMIYSHADYDTDEIPESPSSAITYDPPPATMTKRVHALLELLTSERAYASDLALIRDIHIPLALGLPVPYSSGTTPPASSSSSSRTISTSSSDESANLGAAMTKEDVRIIFGNIAELAIFADEFVEKLEVALGNVLKEGKGPDSVGALFLELIPEFEKPYSAYITRHPTALQHLTALPRTPALAKYLERSRAYASSMSHAWDLPSLLIKPVQRLMKYSLLLTAIIADTPERHPDKRKLRQARERMEEVAMNVNEGRRRWEVVKEVLTATPSEQPKKKGLTLSVAASVNVGRIKGFQKGQTPVNLQETAAIRGVQKKLKASEEHLRKLAKLTLSWASAVAEVTRQLRQWTMSFAAAIGLSPDQPSEAFDAFLAVLDDQLMPLAEDLRGVLKKRYLPLVASLVETMRSPMRLIETMQELEPLHYGLLNINFSKNRPPPALLEASQSYLALRGSLNADLPPYVNLLEKGMATVVIQLAEYQTYYWMDVRDRWSGLWNALRVEGEMNAGADETARVWWERFHEVAEMMQSIDIVNAKSLMVSEPSKRSRANTGPSTVSTAQTVNSLLSSLSATTKNTPSPPSVHGRTRASTSSSEVVKNYRESMGSSNSSHNKPSPRDSNYNSNPTENEFADFVLTGKFPVAPGNMSPPVMPPLTRKNSEPIGGYLYNNSYSSSSTAVHVVAPESIDPLHEFDVENHRGRATTIRRKLSGVTRSVIGHASSSGRSHSAQSNAYAPLPTRESSLRANYPPSIQQRARPLHETPAQYHCTVVHPCNPPPGVEYRDLPFFDLEVGAVYAVLRELGHPVTHPDLPLFVDDGEDCLLLVKRSDDAIGWALASFVMPIPLGHDT